MKLKLTSTQVAEVDLTDPELQIAVLEQINEDMPAGEHIEHLADTEDDVVLKAVKCLAAHNYLLDTIDWSDPDVSVEKIND